MTQPVKGPIYLAQSA